METAKKRILVVENDPDIRDITRMVLEQMGHHEVITSYMAEFGSKLKEKLPDLILLDGGSRRMDAAEICKNLKSQEQTKNTPLLLFSTQIDVEKISREVGADDFLPKPFDLGSLLEKVEKLTRKPEPPA